MENEILPYFYFLAISFSFEYVNWSKPIRITANMTKSRITKKSAGLFMPKQECLTSDIRIFKISLKETLSIYITFLKKVQIYLIY